MRRALRPPLASAAYRECRRLRPRARRPRAAPPWPSAAAAGLPRTACSLARQYSPAPGERRGHILITRSAAMAYYVEAVVACSWSALSRAHTHFCIYRLSPWSNGSAHKVCVRTRTGLSHIYV
eukprot:scaffold98169_cov39-Tisochrysis_lutea.AAC.1